MGYNCVKDKLYSRSATPGKGLPAILTGTPGLTGQSIPPAGAKNGEVQLNPADLNHVSPLSITAPVTKPAPLLSTGPRYCRTPLAFNGLR